MLTKEMLRTMGLRPILQTPEGLWVVECDYPDQAELSEIINIEDNLGESEELIRKYMREMRKHKEGE